MKIKFNYGEKSQIGIIREIGEGQIVWIKGYNGIGKSISGRLLEIISGAHTFKLIKEFNSLKEAIPPLEIKIQFSENEILKIIVRSNEWDFDKNQMKIKDDTVGVFTYNDSVIEPAKAFHLFNTRIIRGDENLSDQIKEIIAREIEEYAFFERHFEKLLENAIKLQEEFFEKTNADKIDELNLVSLAIKETEEEGKKINQRLKEIDILVGYKEKIDEKNQGLENLESLPPDKIIKNIENLKRRIKDIDKERSQKLVTYALLKTELENLSSVRIIEKNRLLEERKEVKNEISDLKTKRDTLILTFSDFDEITEKINESATLINVDSISSYIIKAMDARLKKDKSIEEKEQDLTKKRKTYTLGRSIRQQTLSSKVRDFNDEIIAEGKIPQKNLDLTRGLSIDELNLVVGQRIDALKTILQSEDAKKLENERKKIEKEYRALEELKNINSNIKRRLNKINNINSDLELYSEDETKEYKEKFGLFEDISDRIDALGNDYSILQNNLLDATKSLKNVKGLDKNKLIKSRDALILKIGLKPEDVDSYFKNLQKERLEKDGERQFNKKKLEELKSESDFITFSIESKREELLEKPYDLVPKEKLTNPIAFKKFLGRRYKELLRFNDDLDHLRAGFNRMIHLLDKIQNYYRGSGELEFHGEDNKIFYDIQEAFNKVFLEIYSEETYMDFVFRGYTDIIRFNLHDNTIELKNEAGNKEIRPLEAFSSGQKAFAFARANMSLLSQDAKYKVLILDEFGALLDFIRQEVLQDQLKNEIKKENLDKIIILLPARENLKRTLDLFEIQLEKATQYNDKKAISELSEKIEKSKGHLKNLQAAGYYQEIEAG